MAIIKRIGVLSLAEISAIVMAILGLIFGVFLAILIGIAGSTFRMPLLFGGLGIGVIVIFPILYAAIGFVYGALMALLFNAAAGIAGGLELEIG